MEMLLLPKECQPCLTSSLIFLRAPTLQLALGAGAPLLSGSTALAGSATGTCQHGLRPRHFPADEMEAELGYTAWGPSSSAMTMDSSLDFSGAHLIRTCAEATSAPWGCETGKGKAGCPEEL